MKTWFLFLLLSITVAATFYPCCEYDSCDEQELAGCSDEKKPETPGHCSPLFACAGCAAGVTLQTSFQFSHPLPVSAMPAATIDESLLFTYHIDFWQPPRLA